MQAISETEKGKQHHDRSRSPLIRAVCAMSFEITFQVSSRAVPKTGQNHGAIPARLSVQSIPNALILHPERGTVLGSRLAPVVKPRRRDVRVAEPFLDLGDIGLVRQRVSGRRGAQRMHAQPVDFGADARLQAVFAQDIAVHRRGIERPVQFLRGAIVLDGPEEGTGHVGAVAREREIFLDQPLRRGMHGNKPDFVALALDPKMHHALTALNVPHAQPAQLLTAQAVIEQGSQDGAIAFALERVVWRRFEQLARLRIAERRRAAFVSVRERPFHAIDGIAGDGVALAEVIEQRRQRRQLAPDGGGRQRLRQKPRLQILAPGDDVRPRHGAQLRRPAQPREGGKLALIRLPTRKL